MTTSNTTVARDQAPKSRSVHTECPSSLITPEDSATAVSSDGSPHQSSGAARAQDPTAPGPGLSEAIRERVATQVAQFARSDAYAIANRRGSGFTARRGSVDANVIAKHVAGDTIVVYPAAQDQTTKSIAFDVDGASHGRSERDWSLVATEAGALGAELDRRNLSWCAFTSRSGTGIHIWVFFKNPLQLGSAHGIAREVVKTALQREPAAGLVEIRPAADRVEDLGLGIALPLATSASRPLDRGFQPIEVDETWSPLVNDIQVQTPAERASTLAGVRPVAYPAHDMLARLAAADARLADADVADCVRHLPNTSGPADWEDWNRVGMAIWATTGGSSFGEKLFDVWSRQNPAANVKDTAAERWISYNKSPPNRTGGGALIERVRRTLGDPDWLPDGYALMQRQGKVPPTSGASTTTPNSVGGAAVQRPAAFSTSATPVPFFSPVKSDQANLYPVQWIAPGLLPAGEIAVLAGQGGGAKTACAISLAVGIASGRHQVGPFRVNTRPGGLRVAIVTAEEDAGRIGLLAAAAASVLRLNAAERTAMDANLMLHDASASGWQLGAPTPGSRETLAPEATDRGLAELRAAIGQFKPEVLILDTLAALFALLSEIDNNAITSLMRRLSRAARDGGCAVLVLHHTPKMTRETAAAQRGEQTLVRGGSAIVNSARVVLTLTSLPAGGEASQFAIQGIKPEQVRRIEHVKINDMLPMDPAYFEIKSVQVPVHNNTNHAVRAVEFLAPLPTAAAGGGISNAIRNVAMKAIDAGVLDDHGARLPLSPGASGSGNKRDATQVIAGALMNATPSLAEPHAKAAARDVLKDLRDRIGCVAEQEVQVPQYKANGQSNGARRGRGLVCRWDLAPWAQTGRAEPVEPERDAAPHTDVPPTSDASPEFGAAGDHLEDVTDAQ